MVQFRLWKQPGPVFYPYDQAIYTSPLASESRAFARLDSRDKNGKWATRCDGWMRLSDIQFKTIGDIVDTHDLSRWVIVKEYLPELTNASHISTFFTNFSIPKKLRILPEDVRVQNYRGSKIVDLSCALTDPCPGWAEFEFQLFCTHTIHGVLDWFEAQPTSSLPTSQSLLS